MMTVKKLRMILEQIEKEGKGRLPVCANTTELKASCNDTWNIIDVGKAEVQAIEMVDDDGFKQWNKDETERLKTCVVLSA